MLDTRRMMWQKIAIIFASIIKQFNLLRNILTLIGSSVLLIVGKSEVLDTFTHKHIEILTAYCTCHSAMHFSRQWDIFSGPYLCAYVILAAKELFRGGLASPTGVCQFPSCRCAPLPPLLTPCVLCLVKLLPLCARAHLDPLTGWCQQHPQK